MVDRLRDLLGGNDDDQESRLPEHEYKDPNTVGGGMTGEGGTAVERGTTRIDPSTEDDFAGVNDDMNRRGEVNADDVDAGDLFGGRSETTGMDDDNDEVVPPQARTL